MPTIEELKAQIALEEELARRRAKKRDLPHLTAFPWYEWAYDFFTSRSKHHLLCAANQISKSSTQIRKCIEWATNTSLWPSLWSMTPNQFWYLYPSKPVLEAEFETKWKQFLPKGEMKNDPQYGWKELRKNGDLIGIRFNTDLIVYFKVYAQKVTDLQAGSVFAMFCDEEMPLHLYDELMFRLAATDGYFHMVFTATLGQDFWRRCLEPKPNEQEPLLGAWKRQVSLYDSMKYIDGTPSQWNEGRISQVKAMCKNHNEVLRRVYGKFIMVGGRKYHAFDAIKHMKKPHPIPSNWLVFVGADPGSGGEEGHPAALCYIAVRPDFKQGRVFAGWRGDGILTDNSAIVKEHIKIKKAKKLQPVAQYYDWASKDFFIVASGMDEIFQPADKSHDKGEEIINTLFENDMLAIYETEELAKLGTELSTLRKDQNKRHAKDNFSDSLRYGVTRIPWDFSGISREGFEPQPVETLEKPLSSMQQQIAERRKQFDENSSKDWPTPDEEFDEINELAGG